MKMFLVMSVCRPSMMENIKTMTMVAMAMAAPERRDLLRFRLMFRKAMMDNFIASLLCAHSYRRQSVIFIFNALEEGISAMSMLTRIPKIKAVTMASGCHAARNTP